MFASFLITFREGLEAFLLVGIILSCLSKLNARQYNRYVYYGVMAGVILSLAVAFVFQMLINEFDNELYQQYLTIAILLFAVGVLTYMVIWMQKQVKHMTFRLEEDISRMVTTGNLIGMVFLAFLAVMREGLETILFLSALMYSGNSFSPGGAMSGAVLGLAGSLTLVYTIFKGTRKISLKVLFKYSGLLLIIIAAGLFSSSINIMQSVNWLPVWLESIFDISWILDDRGNLGTFLRALFGYNSSPTLLQFVVWILYLSTFIFIWKKAYRKNINTSSS